MRLLTEEEIKLATKKFYDKYAGKGLTSWEVLELHFCEFHDDLNKAQDAKTLKTVGTQMYESLPSGHVSGFGLMKWAKKWIETLQRGIMPGEEK